MMYDSKINDIYTTFTRLTLTVTVLSSKIFGDMKYFVPEIDKTSQIFDLEFLKDKLSFRYTIGISLYFTKNQL